MPRYRFSALRSDGLLVRDQMEAVNVVKLREMLQHESNVLLDCSIIRNPLYKSRMGSVERAETVLQFCDSLGMLLSTGITLFDALSVMGCSESGRLSTVCLRMTRRLSAGMNLSQCLGAEPNLFADLHVRILSLGEATGTLSSALGEVARSVRWQSDLRQKVRACLSYPIVTLMATLVMSVFLMSQVVPVMREFIESLGNDIQWHTKVLFALSEFVQDWWLSFFSIIICLVLAVVFIVCCVPGLLRELHRMWLSVWLVGPILNRLLLAEFAHHMALMCRIGLTLPDCLEGCRLVSGNRHIKHGILLSRHRVDAGDSLALSMRRAGVFPEFVLQTVAVGEAAGSLDKVFANLATLYRREADISVQKLEVLVGPAVMLVLGFIVLWVVASLFAPLYESMTMLSGGQY